MNVMKKLILAISLWFFFTGMIAQELSLCGDWVGISESNSDYDRYEYFRISNDKGKYVVRAKAQFFDKVKGVLTPIKYYECEVFTSEQKSIMWKQGSEFDYYEVLNTWVSDGGPVSYQESYFTFTVIPTEEGLECSKTYFIKYYDDNGKLLKVTDPEKPRVFHCCKYEEIYNYPMGRWGLPGKDD